MNLRATLGLIAAGAAILGTLGAERGTSGFGRAGSTAASCGAAPASTNVVGSIVAVISSEVDVDTSFAYVGRQLYEGSMVCTSATGQVKYLLTRDKAMYCNSGTPAHLSRVRLYPSSTVAALWLAGWSWCSGVVGSRVTHTTIGKSRLRTADATFGVFLGRRRDSTVKVVTGFADVYGRSTERRALVGPGQQVTVPFGRDPGPAQRSLLSDGDRATIADLQLLVSTPVATRPPPGGSTTLKRLFATGGFAVGYEAARADPRAVAFLRRYVADLARSWGLKASLLPVSTASARKLLASGRIAVAAMVAPPPPSLETLPLLEDVNQTTWHLELVRDDDYFAALRGYLVIALDAGRYASAYRAAFHAEPSYEGFRPVLFP